MKIRKTSQYGIENNESGQRSNDPFIVLGVLILSLFSTAAQAAENTLVPGDSNSRITVENAVVKGDETTVFFLTWPDIGDPDSGKECPLNYYSVKLEPGLPRVRTRVVARNVCSGLLQKSRLLDNGDALIIARDRLERWRAGDRISSQAFSSIDATRSLGITTADMGGQFYGISSGGDVVLAVPAPAAKQGEQTGASMLITGLKPETKRRWKARISQQGVGSTEQGIWSGSDGSALFHTSVLASGLSPSAETRLYFIGSDGSEKLIVLNETGEAMDFQSMQNMSLQDLQKVSPQQKQSSPESIKKLMAVARFGGGFDVLFQREGGGEGREGFFIYRIGPDGSVQSEVSLGRQIEMYGLDRWFDFYLEGDQLILLSKAPVTQKVVRGVKKKWGQIIVSWIDLDTGIPTARLIPLDERYLEAAMSAGDEGQQYLQGQPGSEPVLLTTLGGKPLSVSVGWISKRQVLRVHEADDQLMVFTEVMDENQARLARDASREQRSADRDARQMRMRTAEAEAAGMSEEEYFALSRKEQKQALIQNGGHEKLMESMTQESEQMMAQQQPGRKMPSQAEVPAQPAGMPQDMSAQIAAAMAQAQQQMANDPNVTPEMRAQMEAILSQVGQAGGYPGAGMPAQSAPGKSTGKESVLPANTLKVDTGKRGLIEFANPNGLLMTLLIFDRKTGKELLNRDYPGGVIYDYIDFGQFKLPLKQIGVLYREVSGIILKDLTPVIVQ